MFEKEITSYALNISKRYTGERVPLTVLLTDAELPDDFKKFAEAEVDDLIDREQLGESRTGKFDFSSQEVQSLLKEIRHILKSAYQFPREEFLELVDKASKFIFNYVIRPRWTLEKFFFKGDSSVDRLSVIRASRYLNCYSYYPKGVSEYMEFHAKNGLELETWKKLHAKIDEHLLSTLPAKLSSLTMPVFNLFRFASAEERVPSEAMALFFRDKSAAEIVDRIEFARDVKNIRSLDVMTLAMILEASSSEVSQNVAVLPNSDGPPKEFRTFERQKVTHPIRPEESPKRANEKQPEEIPAPKKLEEPLNSRVTAALEQPGPVSSPEGHSPALRTLMSAKMEDKVVKKIFRGSRSAFQIAVHRIDECADWRSASKVVEGIFIDNDVDPFSKYAVAFTDMVSAKYRASGSGKRSGV